ncbi:hypothetical protein N9E09_01190 [bacterium]|jgi:hypothetical protein|nr:hypothetical protein [bacterium]
MYTVEIVTDKFWIIEDTGIKLGIIRKVKSGDYEIIMQDTNDIEILSFNNLVKKFGSKILESRQVKKIESVGKDSGYSIDEVEGYPCKHRAFNIETIELKGKQIPTYTKSITSKVRYAAGYYGVRFPSDWRWFYGGKLDTLNSCNFIGPYKTKSEMQTETLMANKREVV